MLDTMLDYFRIALYTLLVFVGFLLYQAWENEHTKTTPVAVEVQSERFVPEEGNAIPNLSAPPQAKTESTALPARGDIVKVKTDMLEVSIDTRGGDIIETKLLKFPESMHSHSPFLLLNDDTKTRYLAESGLISKSGPDTSERQGAYTSSQMSYNLEPNQNNLIVNMNWQNGNGLNVIKSFIFNRDSYEIKVKYQIDNKTNQIWQGNLYTQLLRTDHEPPSHGGMVNLTTYFGAAISTPE